MFVLLCLAYFTYHDVLKGYPHGSRCQHSLPFKGCITLCVCRDHSLCIHSSVQGPLGGFHLMAVVTNAAMDTNVQMSPWDSAYSSLGYTPTSGVVGSSHSSIFKFLRNSIIFSTVAAPFYIPVHKQRTRAPIFHLFANTLFPVTIIIFFLTVAILVEVSPFLVLMWWMWQCLEDQGPVDTSRGWPLLGSHMILSTLQGSGLRLPFLLWILSK